MKAVLLGTGTSVGVPAIGCDCRVCTSTDPRNRRRRTSLYLQAEGSHVVVDTPPDFREQAISCRVPRVDAVLFTHSHADHIFGFDDIRRFNTIQDATIPAYADPSTLADLRRIFDYVEAPHVPGVYRPLIDFREVTAPFSVGDIRVTPLPVVHPPKPTLGYRFDAGGRSVGYVPDCHDMPDGTLELLGGLDVMILEALRHRPHPTHLTVEQSLAWLKRIGAKRSFLVHICHELEHVELEQSLPGGISPAFDGMSMEW
jgi:phosphoribosyl 1,2-cyclic phosphate phosphodiesterase